MPGSDGTQLYPASRASWREWLTANHGSARSVQLVLDTKASGSQRLSLDDAVEEAICFGWIDSTLHPLDDRRFAVSFTPRRRGGTWSQTNKARVDSLMERGLVGRERQASGDQSPTDRRVGPAGSREQDGRSALTLARSRRSLGPLAGESERSVRCRGHPGVMAICLVAVVSAGDERGGQDQRAVRFHAKLGDQVRAHNLVSLARGAPGHRDAAGRAAGRARWGRAAAARSGCDARATCPLAPRGTRHLRPRYRRARPQGRTKRTRQASGPRSR